MADWLAALAAAGMLIAVVVRAGSPDYQLFLKIWLNIKPT